MSTISEGRAYTIRFVSSEESIKATGGLCATRSGKEEPLKAAVLVPSLGEHQNWWFVKVHDSGNWYILGESPLPEEPGLESLIHAKLGFSHGAAKSGEPIKLSTPKSYTIKSADKDLYTIAPAPASEGPESIIADFAVGVSGDGEGSKVQIVGEDINLPKWFIERVE
ncbi:hypothetical protein FRC07_000691 [Ceratobasidium sp. 392]|nr:hypothetical protein FRC07_000691 [Ceratobasidium sp. 392]